jgi:hypothetical protein
MVGMLLYLALAKINVNKKTCFRRDDNIKDNLACSLRTLYIQSFKEQFHVKKKKVNEDLCVACLVYKVKLLWEYN